MKLLWFLLFCSVLLIAFVSAAEIDPEVVQALEGQDEVSVMITLKDLPVQKSLLILSSESKSIQEKKAINKQQENVIKALTIKDNSKKRKGLLSTLQSSGDYDLNLKHRYSLLNSLGGKITEKGLEKLNKNPLVEKVSIEKIKHVFLADSIPLINANDAWSLSINGINVNGTGETVCVIDTGINYDHTALGGGWGNKVLTGYDYYNDDADPMDDHGHGTHVAGTIASTDSTYRGVAPGANLIAMKVCNAAGDSCPDGDVLAGIEWCINNASLYNISVISISLGGDQYNYYCDDVDLSYTNLINTAVANNISVVIATGNTNQWYPNALAGIALPGCITNATRVTATTKSDVMASYAFRNVNLPDTLAAPGTSITSTWKNGGYASSSGTSMATPHVSGAVALVQQFNKLVHQRELTNTEIKSVLNNTGKQIDDTGSSGLYFSRIDVYNAILSLDDVSPAITFISPENGSSFNLSVTINVSSNEQLQNVLLEWNGTNESMLGSGTSFYKTKTSLVTANFSFRVYGQDLANNSNVTELRTVTIVDTKAPVLTILAPGNNSLQNYSFNVNVSSDENLQNAILEWNGTNETMLGSGKSFYVTKTNLLSGVYSFRVHGWDLANNTNVSEVRMVTVNSTPIVTTTLPSNDQVFGSNFNLNVTVSSQYNLSSTFYNLTNSSGVTFQYNSSFINGTTFTWTNTINVSSSSFNDGNFTLIIFVNDTVGNSATSNVTIVIDKTAPVIYGASKTPETVYNNDTVFLSVNATDAHLNTSAVYLESNFTGSWNNYTLNLDSGDKYNFTINRGNLSNQKFIVYRFGARDTLGNSNNSEYYNFTVQNRAPINLNITLPLSGAVLEIGNGANFQVTAMDQDSDVLSYFWNFSDGATSTSQNTTHTFYGAGNFTVTLNVSDALSSNITNVSIIVNDTLPPTITTITYDSEVHLQQDLTQNVTSSLLDYSGISAFKLYFNSTLKLGACTNTTNTSSCFWGWGNLTIGNYSFTLNFTDNFTTPHSNSSIYNFTVTSCSDGVKNGNEAGTDCGGACSACSSSSSSSSGGSSSGGSSIPVSVAAVTVPTSTPITLPTPEPSLSTASTGGGGTSTSPPPATVPSGEAFSKDVTFNNNQPTVVDVTGSGTVTELKLSSKKERTVTVSIKTLSEKPLETPEINNVYKYLEIDVPLAKEEIESAQIKFTIPLSWFAENNYSTKKVTLYTLEENQWKALKTKLLSTNSQDAVYATPVEHFSIFAITAEKASVIETKYKIGLSVLTIFIAIALIIWLVHRPEQDDF